MSSSQRYYYEYKLSKDNDDIQPDPAGDNDDVYYNIAITYILKKRPSPGQADDEESLGSIYRGFYLLPNYIIDSQDYLDMIFRCLLVRDDDVRQRLVREAMDFPNQIKTSMVRAGRTSFAIHVSVKVYTVQQEDETIEDARERAIMRKSRSEKSSFINSLKKIKVEIDNPEQEECCICLNKPCVGEEISFLPCSHAYHSKCVITWLVKNKFCPLCRTLVPSNHSGFSC